MLDDFKKSISATLYERAASPLYGTIIISWVLWNWRILYVTFFESFDSLGVSRIEKITNDYLNDPFRLYWWPAASVIILLLLVPFFSNGAYWITMKFEQWRRNQKKKIEGKELLTVEQSVELRLINESMNARVEKLIGEKEEESKNLNSILQSRSDLLDKTRENLTFQNSSNDKHLRNMRLMFPGVVNVIIGNPKFKKAFNQLQELINKNSDTDFLKVDLEFLELMFYYELIGINDKTNKYYLTQKGEDIFETIKQELTGYVITGEFEITEAVYGFQSGVNVLPKINFLLQHNVRTILVNNQLTDGIDPIPGVVKQLSLSYNIGNTYHTLNIPEGEYLLIK